VTVLVAPNGSGKSILLDAVQTAAIGTGKLPLRDRTKKGMFSAFGAVITIGGTCYSANGEGNRDGTNNNHSYNHGAEGPTNNPSIGFARRKAMRNLMGTLLLSAGIPMITAGDERAKSQGGNNNAYCQDNVISWLKWDLDHHEADLLKTVSFLNKLRREHEVLRPETFAHPEPATADRDQWQWFNAKGAQMTQQDWENSEERTLQRFSTHLDSAGSAESMLLVINGTEVIKNITLPNSDSHGVQGFELLWDSALELPPKRTILLNPGARVRMVESSMQLFVAKR
jgi:glycogen operon protein